MHTGDMAHWELALETTTVCPLGSNESHPSHLQKTLTVRDPQSLIHERDSSGLDSRPKASTSTSSPLQRRALGCGCLGMLPLDLRIDLEALVDGHEEWILLSMTLDALLGVPRPSLRMKIVRREIPAW